MTERKQILFIFWLQLKKSKTLYVEAKTQQLGGAGWNATGRGIVEINTPSSNVIVTKEQGTWLNEHNNCINFTNSFRWTLHEEHLSLEHLHQGINHPVFLFDLVPISKNILLPKEPHLCKLDTYKGEIFFDSNEIQLVWQIIGPKKNEKIYYIYS